MVNYMSFRKIVWHRDAFVLGENALVELCPFGADCTASLSTIANGFSAVSKAPRLFATVLSRRETVIPRKAESYPRGKSWREREKKKREVSTITLMIYYGEASFRTGFSNETTSLVTIATESKTVTSLRKFRVSRSSEHGVTEEG